ncbi:MAG: rhodanese-like domain-containing protein, partial [Bacteroidota bacterium]
QFTEQEFEDMATQMAKGSVPDISTQTLHTTSDVILLDTRERKEYNVSHIPRAIWVGYDDFNIKRVQKLNFPKDATIVTYCSVGYRSERIGEQLQKAGYSDVRNLKGSIFKWINEGYEVVDRKGNPTTEVHGYNEKWGKWVKKGKVVY